MGTRFHAIGDVHRAAMYATRPDTVGRYGCVEGKRWREMLGDRISCGKGDCRRVGRRSCKTRRALPSRVSLAISVKKWTPSLLTRGRYSLFPSLTLRSWSGSDEPLLSGLDRLSRGVVAVNHIGVTVGRSVAGMELGGVEAGVDCSTGVTERSVV